MQCHSAGLGQVWEGPSKRLSQIILYGPGGQSLCELGTTLELPETSPIVPRQRTTKLTDGYRRLRFVAYHNTILRNTVGYGRLGGAVGRLRKFRSRLQLCTLSPPSPTPRSRVSWRLSLGHIKGVRRCVRTGQPNMSLHGQCQGPRHCGVQWVVSMWGALVAQGMGVIPRHDRLAKIWPSRSWTPG